jgi:PUA domain protein
MLPRFQIDKGAIKRILSGANIMAPGLTSPGGYMDEVEANRVVAIYAEGKQHALGIGIAIKSTKEIRETNKDIVVEVYHLLCDKVYSIKELQKKK